MYIDPKTIVLRCTHEIEFWRKFGFSAREQDGVIVAPLPARTIAFTEEPAAKALLTTFLKGIGVPPSVALRHPNGDTLLYRVAADDDVERLVRRLPDGLSVRVPGDLIVLPSNDASPRSAFRANSLVELATLPVPPEAVNGSPPTPPRSNPLRPYSLRGSAAQFEARAVECKPLLGTVALSGQATLWYAPPNAGKTLVALSLTLDAIEAGRIDADNVFYINADDSSQGFATKIRLMDDAGAHTIGPNQKGFRAAEFVAHLRKAAERDQATGLFVILDTAKKFTSLMDKKESSTFADACRQFVMRGGSILALAHTNKNPSTDGKLRYAGTTDLLEDFDAAYLLTPTDTGPEERVVEVKALKRRGDSAERTAFSYSAAKGISYEERLASVREVDPATIDEFKPVADQVSDADVITAVHALIAEGTTKKMDLARAVAKRAGIARNAAVRLLERYTGSDPEHHRWTFEVKAHGAKTYSSLPSPRPLEPPLAAQPDDSLPASCLPAPPPAPGAGERGSET